MKDSRVAKVCVWFDVATKAVYLVIAVIKLYLMLS